MSPKQAFIVGILGFFLFAGSMIWPIPRLSAVGNPDASHAANLRELVDSPFTGNVKVTADNDFMFVQSDGIPNHKTAQYPNKDNPNHIIKQDYHFKIPLHPQIANETTPLPMGPIGVAINGIPLYNQFNAQGKDAVTGPNAEVFDSCCGHPDERGRYHYHKYPVCVNSPFKDEATSPSPLMGFAFDGFRVYGPKCAQGKAPTDLDECNGHFTKELGYHYHTTPTAPYILGAYRGVVEKSNFDHPPGGPNHRPGPPPGHRPPPPPR